jgi:CheY-like chemotaxis protein
VRHPKSIVLVVEDEPLMRMHAISLIADAGFETVEASNADEAIAILRPARIFGLFLPTSICLGPWMGYGLLTRYEDAGHQSNLF